MEPEIFKAPVFASTSGDLSIIDESNILPFPMKRIFYIYNTPLGGKRGYHAHKESKQLIFCLFGKIEVFNISVLGNKSKFILDSPDKLLYVPEKTWSYQVNLAHNSIYCVIASDFYDDNDYIRDFNKFKEYIRN